MTNLYKAPISYSRLRTTILMATIVLLCSACSIQPPTQWSYTHPPATGDVGVLPDYGFWCSSSEKAFFIATTGFSTDGCPDSPLPLGEFRVIGIEHIAANDIRSWVIKVIDSKNNIRWIPLPDHNWS